MRGNYISAVVKLLFLSILPTEDPVFFIPTILLFFIPFFKICAPQFTPVLYVLFLFLLMLSFTHISLGPRDTLTLLSSILAVLKIPSLTVKARL